MEDIYAKLDQLYSDAKHSEALDLVNQFRDEDNTEIQWRYARAILKVVEAKASPSPGEKEAIIAEGIEVLNKVLEKVPDCAEARLWAAIMLGSKEKHDSFKQQIEEAFIIKEHVQKTLELDPTNYLAWHVLGNWSFQVATVSWYQRKIAATLFAKPPEATLDEALHALKKAHELNPHIFIHNHLTMAQVLHAMGKKKEASEIIKECIALGFKERKHDLEQVHVAEDAMSYAKKWGVKV